jgi:predicted aspartyl protease
MSLGLTTLTIDLGNPARPGIWVKIDLLVDSGAIYSVVPAPELRRLGIRSISKEEFVLADGSKVVRRKGVAVFRYGKRIGGADVVFGEPGDSTLLGALTLEALGLSLDPLRRELKPLPMILGGWRPDSGAPKVNAASLGVHVGLS